MSDEQVWKERLPEEIVFWKAAIIGHASGNFDGPIEYSLDFAERLKHGREFPHWCRGYIPNAQDVVRFLDLGCGPVTSLGDLWPGHTVEYAAIDPLADQYNEMLDSANLKPQIRARAGNGESLDQMFPDNYFDLCYSSNALDHAYDPVLCYQNMLKVLKPGGWLVTWNAEDEADRQDHQGLHQWNFRIEKGRFVIAGDDKQTDLVEALGSEVASFTAERLDEGWIHLAVQKKA